MNEADKLKFLQTNYERMTISAQIEQLDNQLGKLDAKNSTFAKDILLQFDSIEKRLNDEYIDKPIPTAYQVQWEYVQTRLKKQAATVLRAIGGVDAIKALRISRKVQEDNWWWQLDRYLVEQQKKNIRKALIILGIITGVIIAIVAAYQIFLAPPPEVKARIKHEYAAERHVENGEYQAALQELDLALGFAPGDYQLLIQKGVVNLKLGNTSEADLSFQEALPNADSPEYYYLEKANDELLVGLNEEGALDAQSAIQANPQSAQGYLYLGQAYEYMGRLTDAYSMYEIASNLADQQGDAQLIATVRMRMGMMMQSMSIPTVQP